MKTEKVLNEILDWSSVGLALAAAVVGLIKKDSRWHEPLLAFSITALVSGYMVLKKEWKRHKTDVEGALAAIASEVRVGDSIEERILIRVLQSITFKGAPIDDNFWIGYARMLLSDAKRDPFLALETAIEIRKTGNVPSEEKRYEVMELLMARVKECVQREYLGVAYEEELQQKKAQRFIFELPASYAKQGVITKRLFVVKGPGAFEKLAIDKRAKLVEQLKAKCELKWYRLDDSRPPNFGIYGDLAVGEMAGDKNIIHFNTDRIKSLRQEHWDRCWPDAEVVSEKMLT